MSRPTREEMAGRIRAQTARRGLTDSECACWRGYLAALIEWGLLSPEDHRLLLETLPPLDPDPTLPVLLGPTAVSD